MEKENKPIDSDSIFYHCAPKTETKIKNNKQYWAKEQRENTRPVHSQSVTANHTRYSSTFVAGWLGSFLFSFDLLETINIYIGSNLNDVNDAAVATDDVSNAISTMEWV